MGAASMKPMIPLVLGLAACAQTPEGPSLRDRMRASLDTVRAIDTHEHLRPFDSLPGTAETSRGRGMTLAGIWGTSYLPWYNPIPPWPPGGAFDAWWPRAKGKFDDVRASGFYRYQLPAFQDLYGVDFDRITDAEASRLNDRIFDNYRDDRWVKQVVTERANIDLVFNDPYWARYAFTTSWPFEVMVLNVTPLVRGFHPSEFKNPWDDPYAFARKEGIEVGSFDGYLEALDRLFQKGKAAGAVCLKTTLAYQRSLRFERVQKERAARAFGRPAAELSADEIRDFEDFVMWRLVELSAQHALPFQIHTGHARIQGSNPMLLVDLIEANPKTKFILFHGGYPWIGETAAIVTRHASHVWIDSVWLPTISYTAAKRAYHEWLEVMPSDRILWGGDGHHAEGIYGATALTRRCLAEVLAEKVERGDLLEEHALRIGRQILRDNALKLFPQLESRATKVRPDSPGPR
jgi:uncharacterized protein